MERSITRFSRRPCQTHFYIKTKILRRLFKIIFTQVSLYLSCCTWEKVMFVPCFVMLLVERRTQKWYESWFIIFSSGTRWKALCLSSAARLNSARLAAVDVCDVIASVSATQPRMRPVSIELTGGRVHCRLLPSYRERYRFFKMVVWC